MAMQANADPAARDSNGAVPLAVAWRSGHDPDHWCEVPCASIHNCISVMNLENDNLRK